ncbi:MAG TPA: SAM-dependent chlorinase/fluorinase [Candidatus Acidoferrales bacterium]|nr:SAM-dependent chlorinase/fluorinase [Candidatus Acidoferrales bacterium]
MSAQRIVTLTTDFGIHDHFAGVMRGVVLNINPKAQVVDICNSVNSFDVLDGALTIAQSYSYFPSETVHLIVVDPGVGSARRPILVTTTRHSFVAPDNGVLSLVYAREERITVRHITSEHFFLQPVSNTFHGRDIFAPVAGWLSKGVDPAKFGEEIDDYVRFAMPTPKVEGNTVKAVVLKVDKFGNLITNIDAATVPQLFGDKIPAFSVAVGNAETSEMRTSYSNGENGHLFAIYGSTGYLEVAVNRGSAAQIAQARRGSEVTITFK